jgi:3-isopropylmalate dehydrogenase
MNKKIAILPGDGIGPDIIESAVRVIKKIEEKYSHSFELNYGLIGGAAYDKYSNHLPEETIELCKNSDAILLGAIGGPVDAQDQPKWKDAEKNSLLGIRKILELNVNLRPVFLNSELSHLSPIKKEIIDKGIDFLIIRELIGDVYFGEHVNEGDSAYDVMRYTKSQVETAIIYAFESALRRRKKVTIVDKANVLESSRLWRRVGDEIATQYPSVEMDYMYVDNAAMQIIKNPSYFDVLVTGNLFGDILSDAASVLPGSLGLMPSASIGKEYALYEPIHGSAPDIAGQNIANPIATIMSVAMMFKYSFDMIKESDAIENAINQTIKNGFRTKDIGSENFVGTVEMTDEIIQQI